MGRVHKAAGTVLLVVLASLGLAEGPAGAAGSTPGLAICTASNTVASGAAGPSGLRLSGKVFGGLLTLTAGPGVFAGPTPVAICSSSGPFRGAVVAFFGIDVGAQGAGPVHVTLNGPTIARRDQLQLQGGPQFLERNLAFGPGRLSFDAYQYEFYAVLAPTTPSPARAPAARATPWVVSTIASSLLTPSQAFRPLPTVAIDLAVAVLVTLLITFPAQLFNSTLEENYDDVRTWWGRRLRAITRRPERSVSGPAHDPPARPVAAGVVLLVGGLLGALNDPHFGWHRSSAVTYLAVILAMSVTVSVPAAVSAAYRRVRFRSLGARINALPAGLAVAAGCVLVSRLTGFQPGYLYGVVLGVLFARRLSRHEAGHIAVLDALAMLVVAIAAWVGWASIHTHASKQGAAFGLVLADDVLAALFVAGLVGTVIGLLPLQFLPGSKLREWRPAVWAAVFAAALFGLAQIMLRPHGAAPKHAPVVVTVALFVLFGAGSIAFWDHFDRKHRRARGELLLPIHKRLGELFPRRKPLP